MDYKGNEDLQVGRRIIMLETRSQKLAHMALEQVNSGASIVHKSEVQNLRI